jgi:hypothetical protein
MRKQSFRDNVDQRLIHYLVFDSQKRVGTQDTRPLRIEDLARVRRLVGALR